MNDGFTPAQKKYLERFATKEDVKNIRETMRAMASHMATKDDLKDFATKADLAGMATKRDIERVLAAFDSLGRRLERRLSLLEARA